MVIARVQTIVQLTDDLVAALDARAKRQGVSRSEVIRRAIEKELHDDVERRIDEEIIAGYKRIPAGTPDEWGNLDEDFDEDTTGLPEDDW